MSIAVPKVQSIADQVRALWTPGDVRELRILNTKQRTVSGYFDDVEALAAVAATWSGKAPGVYVTVNPVEPALLARARNRVEPYARTTTSDSDVARRAWLPIDCDATRPAGISSTDAEHEAALARGRLVCRWLIEFGVPRDAILYGDSGNGAHVLVRVDLPNDQAGMELIRRCLEALSTRYDDDAVHIDVSMFNASRIWKTPGTLACKGDNIPERPHRTARWLQAPAEMTVCPTSTLERLARLAPPARQVKSEFSIEDFIARHLPDAEPPNPWQGAGRRWRLSECLFNPDHTDSAALLQAPSGVLAYRCHHNTCLGKTWEDVRELLEPKALRADLTPVREIPPAATNGNSAHPPTTTAQEVAHAPAGSFPLTDIGNAERFAFLHGDDVRYIEAWKRSLIWDGMRWKDDRTGEMIRRAILTVRSIYAESAAVEDGEERQKIWKHAHRSEGGKALRELIQLAQALEVLAAEPEAFDSDPMLLNALNGTIDLRTGELREHRRTDYIRKALSVPYDPDAQAPLWERCLDDWMAGDRTLIDYLQCAVGYSMTGLTVEEVLFLLHGLGRNGKTKFLNAIRYVLSDYAQALRAEALMVKPGSEIPNEIAALVGARMVLTVEISEGARLAESLVKQLTGGDYVSARFMRAEFFEFKPTMKIWMATNHAPRITDTTQAMWERIHLVPFEVTIPADMRDHQLAEKLEREAPGILAWAIRGCMAWQEHGLNPPEKVLAATRRYQSEMDILGQFLADCCQEREGSDVPKGALYARYEAWCESNGERKWSQQLLSRKLRERGFDEYRTGSSRRWLDLALRDEQES